jgi:hypothetical protein
MVYTCGHYLDIHNTGIFSQLIYLHKCDIIYLNITERMNLKVTVDVRTSEMFGSNLTLTKIRRALSTSVISSICQNHINN